MTDNYARIARDNLKQLYAGLPENLAAYLPGKQTGNRFEFRAFGETCRIGPDEIILGEKKQSSVFDILISLYALNARPDPCVPLPFKAFKEFADSMPYAGAFATHTENILVPHVNDIKNSRPAILDALDGEAAPAGTGGDFSFTVRPLPKITLCYLFYEADEDFPAAVTCLYSQNARLFMPLDGLADVGEYCSKKILALATGAARVLE